MIRVQVLVDRTGKGLTEIVKFADEDIYAIMAQLDWLGEHCENMKLATVSGCTRNWDSFEGSNSHEFGILAPNCR